MKAIVNLIVAFVMIALGAWAITHDSYFLGVLIAGAGIVKAWAVMSSEVKQDD